MEYEIEEVSLPESDALAIRETHTLEELPAFIGEAFGELERHIAGIDPAAFAGPPFARYHTTPPGPIDVEVAFPLARPMEGGGRISPLHLPGGPAVQTLHVGPYDAMAPAYEAVERWLADHGHQRSEPPREVYLTSPDEFPDPKDWRTLVVQPLVPA